MKKILQEIDKIDIPYEAKEALKDVVYILDGHCKVSVNDFSIMRNDEFVYLYENDFIVILDDKIYFTKEFIEYLPGLKQFIENNKQKCQIKTKESKIRRDIKDKKYKAYLKFLKELEYYCVNFKLKFKNSIVNFGNIAYRIKFDDKATVEVSVIDVISGHYVMTEDEIGFWEWFAVQPIHQEMRSLDTRQSAEIKLAYGIIVRKSK